MKRILRFTAILAAALTLLTLFGCANLRKPEDGEIRTAVEKLLPRAYDATYIVYGPGAPIDPLYEIDEEWKTAHYLPVSYEYPYNTRAKVEELVRGVFSEKFAEEILTFAFENNDDFMSRYGETNGRLTRDVTKEPFEMYTDIYPETLTVTKGTAFACEATVECSADGGKTRMECTLQLVKENDRWYFDGPAY